MKNEKNENKENFINSLSTIVNNAIQSLLSNLRFSISLRISLNYLRLLLETTIMMLFIFTIGYIAVIVPQTTAKEKVITSAFETNTKYYSNPFNNDEVRVQVKNDKGEIIYSDIDESRQYNILDVISSNRFNNLFLLNEKNKNIQGQDYSFKIEYNLTNNLKQYKSLMITLIVIEIIRISSIMTEGKKLNRKVLLPIQDITEMAQRMNASILNERINVAGTKNELKDLAVTINNMIERIETSYNSQKQFVSDASHELRTPISVIQGYANLLDRWGKEDKEITDEAIKAIINESKNMQELVEKLLFLARHDKKTLQLEKENFNVKELIEEMIKETEMIANNHVINNSSLDEATLFGDKQSIKQAIRVFIDNAIKYTPQGGRIYINCEKKDNTCIISVRDTGIGMSYEDLSKIFDRFYRAGSGRNINNNGHGLGLSIAKLIILAHNGKIKVRSKINEGTIFEIYLETT